MRKEFRSSGVQELQEFRSSGAGVLEARGVGGVG